MDALLAALAALGAGGVLQQVVARYVRPRATPAEELEQVRADRAEDRAELQKLQRQMRALSDYVHILREHIASEQGPPPPAWPEGLSQ